MNETLSWILFYILLNLYYSINGENSLVYCPRVSKSRSCRASWFAGTVFGPTPALVHRGVPVAKIPREKGVYLDRIRCTKQSLLPLLHETIYR